MTTAIAMPDEIDSNIRFYDEMTEAEFIDAIRELAAFAGSVVRIGVSAWRLAEKKGWSTAPLAAIAGGIIAYVVNGGLVPEAAEKFFGHNKVIEAVRLLPPAVQVELANDKPVPVVDPTDPSKTYDRTIPEMTPSERKRVFQGGKVLSPMDQRMAMTPPAPSPNGKRKLLPATGINKRPPKGSDKDKDVAAGIMIVRLPLTHEQYRRLTEAAARGPSGVEPWELVWDAVNNARLI